MFCVDLTVVSQVLRVVLARANIALCADHVGWFSA